MSAGPIGDRTRVHSGPQATDGTAHEVTAAKESAPLIDRVEVSSSSTATVSVPDGTDVLPPILPASEYGALDLDLVLSKLGADIDGLPEGATKELLVAAVDAVEKAATAAGKDLDPPLLARGPRPKTSVRGILLSEGTAEGGTRYVFRPDTQDLPEFELPEELVRGLPLHRPVLVERVGDRTVVRALARDGGTAGRVAATSDASLPPTGGAARRLEEICARHNLTTEFPPAVEAEVRAIEANPGIDDPTLVDMTELPFITIDNPDSKDLDQAMCIQRTADGGYEVSYALADAGYYVRPGTALFEEALRRMVTYYLPGFSVPMLPRALSEKLVSLNANENRRAVVFKMKLDADGKCLNTDVVRARVRSRAKLTYGGVQDYCNDPKGHPYADQAYTETLDLLRTVGQLRIADAEDRDVVQYDRVAVKIELDRENDRLLVAEEVRYQVDEFNAEISKLCNGQGGELLKKHVDPSSGVLGLFRVHPPPSPERLDGFRRQVRTLVQGLALDPERWDWHREPPDNESLADYIDRLPDEGPGRRLAMAIQRQALLISDAASFSTQPGRHYGVGAAAYSRFSSPMREMVGIVTHLLANDQLFGDGEGSGLDAEVFRRIIEASKDARRIQARIAKETRKIAIDALFSEEMQDPEVERKIRSGTVMGVTSSKIYVQLDDPPIEVKVYVGDLSAGGTFELRNQGTELWRKGDDEPLARIGSEIRIRAANYDFKRDRWIFEPQ